MVVISCIATQFFYYTIISCTSLLLIIIYFRPIIGVFGHQLIRWLTVLQWRLLHSGTNYKACAATKHKTNQSLQLHRPGPEAGSQEGLWQGPGEEKQKYTNASISQVEAIQLPQAHSFGKSGCFQNDYLGFISSPYSPQNQAWVWTYQTKELCHAHSLPQTRSTKKMPTQNASLLSAEQTTHNTQPAPLI